MLMDPLSTYPYTPPNPTPILLSMLTISQANAHIVIHAHYHPSQHSSCHPYPNCSPDHLSTCLRKPDSPNTSVITTPPTNIPSPHAHHPPKSTAICPSIYGRTMRLCWFNP
ncbi:unnamed protein product [Ilex paraguariensis]|uniref:Uncharacterized protein n=1 Tax=Ilex paraguariensis TaxID=185542 RepID=A0ABC8SUB7_9AQUA